MRILDGIPGMELELIEVWLGAEKRKRMHAESEKATEHRIFKHTVQQKAGFTFKLWLGQ